MTDEKRDYDLLCGYLHHSIVGIRSFDGGAVEVLRQCNGKPPTTSGKREEITIMTKKSRERMLFLLNTTQVEFKSMITLTYGVEFPLDGRACKQHLDRFLKAYRRSHSQSYFWFIEFQARGAPHYHILSGVNHVFQFDREWLAQSWVRATSASKGVSYCQLSGNRRVLTHGVAMTSAHTHQDAWQNIREDEGAKRYVAKYALKTKQKEIPEAYQNIGRWWGASRDVRDNVKQSTDIPMTGEELNITLEALGHTTADWLIKPKYLFGIT